MNVHPTPLPLLLSQTLPITQHLASTILFISIFIRLSSQPPSPSLSPLVLLGAAASVAVVCRALSPSAGKEGAQGGGNGATGVIPMFTLYLLSPALKTLTKATTSDSIWALSGTLFSINLLLGDYRSIPSSSLAATTAQGRTSTLPLTAALSASTVLASRLSSNLEVFSLLAFSTTWFGPFPLLRSSLPLRPTVLLTLLLVASSLISLAGVAGRGTTIGAAVLMGGVAVGAPLGRGWMGLRYKDRVRGPWDQAVPRVH